MEDVLETVLAAARPDRVVSGASGAGLRGAEGRALARRGLSAAGGGLPGEPLALGPLVTLARARGGAPAGPWLVTATWKSDYGALLWPQSGAM